jgi:anti-anti-sigma factor
MLSTSECAEHSRIDSMNIGGRIVLAPEGSVTHENCHQYKEKIETAIQGKKPEIIFDCRQVDLFDSAALEFLIQIHAELRSKGGALKIVGLNEVCRDILLVTRVMNVLFVYEDIHDAIMNIP